MRSRLCLALVALAWLVAAMPAAAQTKPVIRVVGKGIVGMNVAAPDLATAQSYVYKAYVGASASGVTVTVVCGNQSAGVFDCVFPLSQLPLTSSPQTLAVTASVVAVDGTAESPRGEAPFVLQLVGPPAAPGVLVIRTGS